DGTLEFIGRADHQIKLHGHRIELGEIEAVLTAHPRVSQAVVVVREDQPGDRSLVAYFVGANVAAEQLQSYLAKRLPGHMVPSAFVALAALPLASSGKVDREQLPGPSSAASMTRGYEAPRGATEEALAKLWAAELGVARVGRNDRFFDVGGHSLLGMQVVLRMRQELGMVVGLSDLFRWPRLADFARVAAEETDLVESVLAQVEGSSGTDVLMQSRDPACSNGELGEAVR
ncbi:MAG: AMP-binding enzyme, partial [Gemmatimonadaceae bacterium]